MTLAEYIAARPAPAHLLILGDDPAGLEMADAHAALGCRVTLLTRGRLAAREDPELALGLALALRRRGVVLVEHAEPVRAEPGPCLVLADGTRLAGTHLLVAAGTAPELAALAPEAAGLVVTPRGIATDRVLRCHNNRRVCAAGAVADPDGSAGTAPAGATRAAAHAGLILRRAVLRLPAGLTAPIPRVLYTAPELAQVGMTEAEARAAGHQVRILRWPLADTERARLEQRPEGVVKLVLSRRWRLLGAGMLAPEAGTAIGVAALALGRRHGAAALAGQVAAWPSRAEALSRAAAMRAAHLATHPWLRRLVRLLARLA